MTHGKMRIYGARNKYLEGTVGGHVGHGIRNAVKTVHVVDRVSRPGGAVDARVVGPAVGGVHEVEARLLRRRASGDVVRIARVLKNLCN